MCITAKLAGKRYFSVFDFKDGYYQVKLDEPSSNLTTFSTPFGCYKFLRRPFGLNMAPEYFQKVNLKNVEGIENVIIYFDDLLIATDTLEQHNETLRKVVLRAKEKGVRFNKEKLQFRLNEVKYLGHLFNKEGVRIDEDKLAVINDLRPPSSAKELQKLLGLVNYVRRFIRNLGEISSCLYSLLKKDAVFQWLSVHQKALDQVKTEINKNITLKNFDSKKDIVVKTDASQNGIGCVLLEEGRPVAYASRALTDAEKRYAVIEKEMTSVVYATKIP